MSNNRLKIELDSKIDKNGQKYYVGRMKSPISLNCENGIVFMVFISEEGEEELQILSPKKSKLPRYQMVPVEKMAKKKKNHEDMILSEETVAQQDLENDWEVETWQDTVADSE